jgi:two-component system, NarL family, invasion response regulator UvrY
MKVLIADDHAIVRKGLIQIVNSLPQVDLVDEAEDGNQVLEMYKKIKYDLIILDLSMPNKNGLDTLKDIIRIDPKAKVLILSVYAEEQYAIRSFNSGAYGYITKNTAPTELLKAVEHVLIGKKYVSPSLAERLINLKSIEKPLHDSLSDREFQIMMMSADGYSIAKISEELNISVKTVSTYRKRILEKMNFENFIQVMHYAIDRRL